MDEKLESKNGQGWERAGFKLARSMPTNAQTELGRLSTAPIACNLT